jgi:hypothetical protein
MAKHTLHSGEGDLDFLLLGLLSQENVYSVVSMANHALGLEFELNDHVPFNLKEGKLFYFSLYHCESEEFGLEFFLIPNVSDLDASAQSEEKDVAADLFSEMKVEESVRLIKELPKTDYFIIVKGEDMHLHQFNIVERLKAEEGVLQVQIIEPRELPSRMNLVF